MQLEVVLNKNVANLGKRGELVKVKRGYFRNYLYPQGSAVIATTATKKLALERAEKVTAKIKAAKENAETLVKSLSGVTLNFQEKASKNGKLYGAITEETVSEALLSQAKLEIPKEFVSMQHIKATGEHKVSISFDADHAAEITVKVDAQ